MRWLISAAIVLSGTLAAQAEPTVLPPSQMLEWNGDETPEVQQFRAGDLEMSLSFQGDEMAPTVTLTVEAPGLEPVTVTEETFGAGFGLIGTFPFDEGGGTSVIFAAYSGGAHCCLQLSSVVQTTDGLVVSSIASVDGDRIEPADIDGDGVAELVLPDDRFNYQFESYAGSIPPPTIWKSRQGQAYDASNEAQFRPFYERKLTEYEPHCSGEGDWEQGYCAALLAVAARLGRFEEFFAPIDAAIRGGKTMASGWEDFSFCTGEACEKTVEFTQFPEAVTYALKEWGYVPG
jgi:hypothetical protein